MAVEKEIIIYSIKKAIPDAELRLVSLGNDNDHYALEIGSNMFKGKNRIEQHRMVNNALKDCLGTSLHALQINTYILGEKND